jgi:hypothetical protein
MAMLYSLALYPYLPIFAAFKAGKYYHHSKH